MSDKTDITQSAGLGAKGNTFVGEQNNYYGLTPADAAEIAFSIFREYFPQLRQDALKEVHSIVENELQKIPASDIRQPSAKIVVPLLENASITEEPNLREMYGKLLASDMNEQKKSLVHPAYVSIINQMSSDDAYLFKRIVKIHNSIPLARVRFSYGTYYLSDVMPHYFSPYFKDMDCWKASLSIENLSRLNIINLIEGSVAGYNYDAIKQEQFVKESFTAAKKIDTSRELSIEMTKYAIQINDFGRGLSRLCF